MRPRIGQFITLFRFSVAAILTCLAPALLVAQDDFHHPELNWKTIETTHFYVHFHDGAERTARTVAKIAEDIYEPVTSLYQHVPDQKVSFVIHDYDDYSNGAAYFYDNKVDIWAPSMDFVFRGAHNWLRNVITHEFTHIVQIQTAMKFGRKLPSFYFQWLGYESERRPDVLYGYPNVVVSYPLSGFVVPAWFAEGVAQYNRKDLRYDFWDSHRDMILRSYILADSGLTWEQMAVFGKNSHGNESSYNAGFAFVHYIAQRYGEDKLLEISRNLSSFGEMTIGGAIGRAVGKDGEQVYDEWRAELKKAYAERVVPIKAHLVEGKPVTFFDTENSGVWGGAEATTLTHGPGAGLDPRGQMPSCCREVVDMGFANLYPRFSPDGKHYAFVSTVSGDYFGQSSLLIADRETHKAHSVVPGVLTGASWSPDGKKLYYGRTTRDHPHWSLQSDLYVYDVAEDKETRITHNRRADFPSVSPDGRSVVCVVDSDGTRNLAVMGIDGSDYRLITHYANGEQVYNPSWNPAGDRILFDYSIRDGRDIAWVRPDGSDPEFLLTGPADTRYASFTPDGSRVLFSSDTTGIFNLYSLSLATRQVAQISNVLGGAFLASADSSGTILYSAYTSSGYKLYSLRDTMVSSEGTGYAIQHAEGFPYDGPLALGSGTRSIHQFDWTSLRSYDDRQLAKDSVRNYRNIFTSLSIVPFIRVDNYNVKNEALDVIKPGVYMFSRDVTDRLDLLVGAAINRRLERDLFTQINYYGKMPGFYQLGWEPSFGLELYNVTRKASNSIGLAQDTIPVDVTYNLMEFDFVLKSPFLSQFAAMEFRYMHSRYSAAIETFVYDPGPGYSPILFSASDDLYLIANVFSLRFDFDMIRRSATSEINPIGRKISLRVDRELNKFNGDNSYEVKNGLLLPLYKKVNFTRAELTWKEHIPFFFKNHTLTISARGGTILEHSVDEFFDFYAGGLIGMRGYPFYAIGGNELATAGLNYRFPIFDAIDARIFQLYFSKLYGSIYADIGNAWTSEKPRLKEFKKDVGMELRLESFSFYAYPTRLFLGAAYGLDKFQRYIRSRDSYVTYGKEWRIYFGILFSFDFD
jgi:Tol biopolymer transport system component